VSQVGADKDIIWRDRTIKYNLEVNLGAIYLEVYSVYTTGTIDLHIVDINAGSIPGYGLIRIFRGIVAGLGDLARYRGHSCPFIVILEAIRGIGSPEVPLQVIRILPNIYPVRIGKGFGLARRVYG